MPKLTPLPLTPLPVCLGWVGGGYNSAMAVSKKDAMAKARALWPGHEAAPSTVRRITDTDAYYRSIPFWG